MRKLSSPGGVVTDFSASICSTAKARVLFDQRRAPVGCDLGSKLRTAADTDFVLSFASWVLNSKSDTSGRPEVIPMQRFLKTGGL